MAEQNEDTAVQDFLEILEEHRKNCERQGKYVEAEIAKNRLEELKLHEENRRREAMRSRQIAERLGVEEAHMLEFQKFNEIWDKKMTDYENYAENMVIIHTQSFILTTFILTHSLTYSRSNQWLRNTLVTYETIKKSYWEKKSDPNFLVIC